jgi:ABC-2 type transport system permease protein
VDRDVKIRLRVNSASTGHFNATEWLPAASLWRREVVRFLRQRSRVIGALGTPVVFWLLIGSGLGRSFRPPGTIEGEDVHFLEYAYPGTLVLIVLFTAIFAMISIIEDRKAGFLQAVIASPASRISIVLGKVLGSTTLALGQAALVLLLAPLAGVPLTVTGVLATMGVLLLLSLGLSGLGFLIAWPMESTQGFHAIMNLGLMPMWFLSGALFPSQGASAWLRTMMTVNPLTYGVSLARCALYSGSAVELVGQPSTALSLLVTISFAGLTIAASVYLMEKSK